jgi:DNA repair exonuclease SbcCD ATPase subunit
LWQSLAERAKGRADLLKNATEKEQRIVDLERELKEVHEAAAAEKKKLEDELAEEKRVTPVFPKKTKCKPICMPGSIFMHIVDISE